LDWYLCPFLALHSVRLTIVGHDWGCGAVWSFVACYPEKTIAAAGLCVPYGLIEHGLDELIRTVDRSVYPENEYPYGQWSYQKYYETNFEDASNFFDSDIRGCLRAFRMKGDPTQHGKPATITATVVRDGGWFGGAEKPDPYVVSNLLAFPDAIGSMC
jgi:soluble epoxide hydrolase / lipid-phosphate phosphatase